MQMNRRMVFKEVPDRLTLMSRKIVGDDMDFFAPGLIGNDVVEEGDKFSGGVSRCSLTEYLTCFGVESCIQRERAMSVVLEAMTFRAARRKGKDGILPIQRLNGALFIDAEHHGMLRRVQIQSDDVSSLGFKIRVVGSQIALASMRSQSMFSPHTRNHHVGDMQLRSQFRVLQCVDPSLGLRLILHSRMRASTMGVSVVAACPARRLNNPAKRSRANRLLQRSIKLSGQSSFSRIAAQV